MRSTHATRQVYPGWLTEAERESAERVLRFIGNISVGFVAHEKVGKAHLQQEEMLELQGDMDDLARAGLLIAIGYAEIIILPPPGLSGEPDKTPTLIVSVTRPGAGTPHVVVPLISEWFGEAVRV
jgi:hypothetical protein